MKKCAPGSTAAQNAQSIIWREGDEVCVRLARRKNRPRGSGTMRRQCSCAGGVRTCAVHTLWERFFAHLPDGTCPWTAVSPNHARARLRQLLQTLGVPDAGAYGTHDLRRGHAEAGFQNAYLRCLLLRGCVSPLCTGHASMWTCTGRDPRCRSVEERRLHQVCEGSGAGKGSGVSSSHRKRRRGVD